MTLPQYQSISCQMHSELELAIMHKKHLQIYVRENNTTLSLIIQPYDIISRKGEGEFLLAIDNAQNKISLRLDQIKSFKQLS